MVPWDEQVIQSSMEPPGNNQCGTWTGVEFQVACLLQRAGQGA